MVNLAALVSHPIQYQAPLFREIAKQPGINLKVFFLSDFSVNSYKDKEFEQTIKWDIPVLDGYNYEFLPFYGSKNILSFLRPLNYGLFKRLKESKFDALWIHGYANQNCIRAIFQARKLGTKVFLRGDSKLNAGTTNPFKLFVKNIFLKWLFKNYSGFLSVGSQNKAYYLHYGVPEDKIIDMPYSVDNSFFQQKCRESRENREAFRSSLGLQPNRPIILFAGKLLTRKHPIDLLEAYIKLSPNGIKEPLPYLLIIGDGEEYSRLIIRAKQTNWESIKFLGFQNQTQLPAYFDLCDVFVLPSTREPWGLIVNEVMNAGKPVIVSDEVGCSSDLVKNNINGFIYPARDIDALKQCLEKIVNNPKCSHQMGMNGLKIINSWGFKEDIIGLQKALGI